jgi:hypothetical protein
MRAARATRASNIHSFSEIIGIAWVADAAQLQGFITFVSMAVSVKRHRAYAFLLVNVS